MTQFDNLVCSQMERGSENRVKCSSVSLDVNTRRRDGKGPAGAIFAWRASNRVRVKAGTRLFSTQPGVSQLCTEVSQICETMLILSCQSNGKANGNLWNVSIIIILEIKY